MYLEKISILNFKNIEQADLAFCNKINCLLGNNGAGKTNLLDAVYFLSMSKSALNLTDGQCVRHGSEFLMLRGDYTIAQGEMGEKRESITCSFKKGAGKTLKRNGKEYERITEHIGLLPIVLVSPSDTALIQESGDERRRFMNAFLSQTDHAYMTTLMRYNQLLAERNRLLKIFTGFEDVIDIIDMQLVETGEILNTKRREFTRMLAPIVADYYRLISADSEQIEITYRSELNHTPFADLLRASTPKDRIMGHTTCGIHRDDLQMTIMDYPIRKYGSQGQQKSMLIALKLAQFDIIKEQMKMRPILLLDDVFDKLDLGRVEQLLELVSGNHFGQIFISDSNKVRMESILECISGNYTLFDVNQGGYQIQENNLSEQ